MPAEVASRLETTAPAPRASAASASKRPPASTTPLPLPADVVTANVAIGLHMAATRRAAGAADGSVVERHPRSSGASRRSRRRRPQEPPQCPWDTHGIHLSPRRRPATAKALEDLFRMSTPSHSGSIPWPASSSQRWDPGTTALETERAQQTEPNILRVQPCSPARAGGRSWRAFDWPS